MNLSHENRLSGLLLEWHERRQQGAEAPVELLCRECPELAEELARQIKILRATDWLFDPDESSVGMLVESTVELTSELQPAVALLSDLGDFQLGKRIASGGMGTVFEAHQRSLNRRVAVKTLKQRVAPDAVARMLFEARTAAKLEHPNIVKILQAGECNGAPWFAMTLVENKSLAHWKQEHRPAHPATNRRQFAVYCEAAATMVATVARAVHYAHQNLVLHCDLKPSNVLLEGPGSRV